MQYIVQTATELGRGMKLSPVNIEPIPTSDYLIPVALPANSVLDCRRLQNDLHISLPD